MEAVDSLDLRSFALSDPLLVVTSSGATEKLEIARLTYDFSTLGAELVSSCLNALAAAGATPLFFSYGLVGGDLGEGAGTVGRGIKEACSEAGCPLLAGQAAPSAFGGSVENCDLAGFAVGAVERSRPTPAPLVDGDVVFGFPGSAVDGSVVSLARRVLEDGGIGLGDPAPFSLNGQTFARALLSPTTALPSALRPLLAGGAAKALVSLAGAGIGGAVEPALPAGLGLRLVSTRWPLPPLLGWLASQGCSEEELLSSSSLGLVALLVVAKDNVDVVKKTLEADGLPTLLIGSVESLATTGKRTLVSDLPTALLEAWPRAQAPPPRRRVAVLVTDCGRNLGALIAATRDPRRRLNADIVLVVGNKPGGEALEVARSAGIPTQTIPHRGFPSREEFDMAVDAALTSNGVDLICLARFVRILSGTFTRRWRGRVINLHPAILPLFKGIHVQKQALDAGVRLTGCSVHFVEEAVDAGAIIIQEPLAIEPRDSVDTLLERMKRLEVRIYPRALALVATGRVAVGLDGRIVWNF